MTIQNSQVQESQLPASITQENERVFFQYVLTATAREKINLRSTRFDDDGDSPIGHHWMIAKFVREDIPADPVVITAWGYHQAVTFGIESWHRWIWRRSLSIETIRKQSAESWGEFSERLTSRLRAWKSSDVTWRVYRWLGVPIGWLVMERGAVLAKAGWTANDNDQ